MESKTLFKSNNPLGGTLLKTLFNCTQSLDSAQSLKDKKSVNLIIHELHLTYFSV